MPTPPELQALLIEATQQAEDMLSLEDRGWSLLGQQASSSGVTDAQRIQAVKDARVYGARDPLAVQAIRLWTTYAFGTGMSFDVPDLTAKKVVDRFWLDPENRGVLSSSGQRKSSDRCLTDGEIFFVVFVDARKTARIRRLDPLEMQIITNPDDVEDVMFYRRKYTDTMGDTNVTIYLSPNNLGGENVKDSEGKEVTANSDGVVFHLAINTIGQRGNSLLLPALEWLFLHRRFLASRAAVMLALSRFALKGTVKGGAAAVAGLKAALDNETPEAGSVWLQNQGVDLKNFGADTGAKNAYNDDRMLKLQVFSAFGFPEHYFGDVSMGNLATAKTIEAPILKQIQTYQDVWTGTYNEIDQYVMAVNRIPVTSMYIDRDFPAISPEDAGALAENIERMVGVFPELADSREVLQQALLVAGVDDVQVALDKLEGTDDATTESGIDLSKLTKLTRLAEVIARGVQPDGSRNGHSHEEDEVRVVRGNGEEGV